MTTSWSKGSSLLSHLFQVNFLFSMPSDLPLAAKILLTLGPELLLLAGVVGAIAYDRLSNKLMHLPEPAPVNHRAPWREPKGLAAYRVGLGTREQRVTEKVLDPKEEFAHRPTEAHQFSVDVARMKVSVQTQGGERIELGYNARDSLLGRLPKDADSSGLTPRASWVLDRVDQELQLREGERDLLIRLVQQASTYPIAAVNEKYAFPGPAPEAVAKMKGLIGPEDLVSDEIARQLPTEDFDIRASQNFEGLTYDERVEEYVTRISHPVLMKSPHNSPFAVRPNNTSS
jgi:hypothetical protein